MENAHSRKEFENLKTIVVHYGTFHADDVFTVAYVQVLRRFYGLDMLKVVRTFKPGDFMTLENGYLVADTGNGEFDHHFPEADKKRRTNGVPYAAFGLVVKAFHHDFLTEDEYTIFDKKFIEPIDYHDNCGGGNQLSYAISLFNRNWDDPDPNIDKNFFDAVNVATAILEKAIKNIRSFNNAMSIADSQVIDEETHAVYMDKYAPVEEFFAEDPRVLYIGSPSLRNTYQMITVKDPCKVSKKLFPERIRGVSYPDGVFDSDGLSFCHPSGFMATFRDKEAARAYIKKYMEDFKNVEM